MQYVELTLTWSDLQYAPQKYAQGHALTCIAVTVWVVSGFMVYNLAVRCTKSQDLNDFRLFLQLSLPNSLKLGVKSGMKM